MAATSLFEKKYSLFFALLCPDDILKVTAYCGSFGPSRSGYFRQCAVMNGEFLLRPSGNHLEMNGEGQIQG